MATATASPATASTVVPPLRRRGSSRLLLLGVVLAALGALLGAYAFRELGQRSGVVALARPVAFGEVIDRADLREAALPNDTGLSVVAWDQVDSVIGRTAGTDLFAGQPLPPEAVAQTRVPRAGEAVVGMAAEPGRLPATALAVRDQVLVVGESAQPPIRASVLRVGQVDASGRRTVDLLVAEVAAVELARAVTADGSVLVLVGQG